jgi:hypothetical protein
LGGISYPQIWGLRILVDIPYPQFAERICGYPWILRMLPQSNHRSPCHHEVSDWLYPANPFLQIPLVTFVDGPQVDHRLYSKTGIIHLLCYKIIGLTTTRWETLSWPTAKTLAQIIYLGLTKIRARGKMFCI